MGGGERFSLELTKTLSKHHETTLLAFGEERKSIQMQNLHIETYPNMFRFNQFLKFNHLSDSFLKELTESDVIHIHQLRMAFSCFSSVFGRLRNKSVFITDHGGRDGLGTGLAFVGARLASCLLPVSRFSANELKAYSKMARIIYGGVDVSRFGFKNVRRKPDKVLFVGRFVAHKGCEYLVEAVQDLDVELHLIGSPLDSRVVNSIKALDKNNRVKFKFHFPDEDLSTEYSSSLVTVLPSVYRDFYGNIHPIPELLGLTLLESMACETPVICTRVGGMPEIVTEGENGFIVEPNNPDSLKEKIAYFINNPEEARHMGHNARRTVLKKYTWDAVANRCLTAYNEFC